MNYKVCVIDTSGDWHPAFIEQTGKIEAVFAYECDKCTYCCELAPSYFLRFLYFVAENTDENIHDVLLENSFGDHDCYMWCLDVCDLVELCRYLDDPDSGGYSMWCADYTAREMPAGWEP